MGADGYPTELPTEIRLPSLDSLALHVNTDGELEFERTLLHVSLIEGLLEGRARRDCPRVTFMAGGPAAGKGALRSALGLTEDTAVVIDVDEIREKLPEYERWKREQPEQAAALTHREASQVSKLALAQGLERGYDIVFDTVGGDDEGSFSAKITGALNKNAVVVVLYATVPVELALEREEARFAHTRRRVSKEILRAKHAEVSRGIHKISRLRVERIAVYDMSGEEPQLVAEGPGGEGLEGLEAVHEKGYAAFLKKADHE